MIKFLKRLFQRRRKYKRLTDWQLVFSQSRVNGAEYVEPEPVGRWKWPERKRK